MVTGYEAGFYNDVDLIEKNIRRIADALEKIAEALTTDVDIADTPLGVDEGTRDDDRFKAVIKAWDPDLNQFIANVRAVGWGLEKVQ